MTFDIEKKLISNLDYKKPDLKNKYYPEKCTLNKYLEYTKKFGNNYGFLDNQCKNYITFNEYTYPRCKDDQILLFAAKLTYILFIYDDLVQNDENIIKGPLNFLNDIYYNEEHDELFKHFRKLILDIINYVPTPNNILFIYGIKEWFNCLIEENKLRTKLNISFDEYLEFRLKSIGLRAFMELSLPAIKSNNNIHIKEKKLQVFLKKSLKYAILCNDLASYKKELKEGDNFNSIFILSKEYNISNDKTITLIDKKMQKIKNDITEICNSANNEDEIEFLNVIIEYIMVNYNWSSMCIRYNN
jgi:hypothetical protein